MVGLALGLTGCESPTSQPAEQPTPGSISVGMTPAEVQGVLGEPAEVVADEVSVPPVQMWVYRNELPSEFRDVMTRMEEIPFVNPRSGVMTTIEEPVTSQERIDRIEVLTLLFQGNQLAKINRQVEENRTLNR